jgi:hypothetical protein
MPLVVFFCVTETCIEIGAFFLLWRGGGGAEHALLFQYLRPGVGGRNVSTMAPNPGRIYRFGRSKESCVCCCCYYSVHI